MPKDDSIRFNIATIQQKGLEIIQELAPNRRTVVQVKEAIAQAQEAQTIFQSLASVDGKTPTPYSIEMAQQRVRYGTIQIGKASSDTLVSQEQYEAEELAKQEATRGQREAEKARQQQLEAARLEEIRIKNAALAEERRRLQEAAKEWMEAHKAHDSDEDRTKKKRGPRKKAEAADGAVGSGEEGEEKPKKRPAKRKSQAKSKAANGAEGEAVDPDEDEEMPVAKKSKKSNKNFVSPGPRRPPSLDALYPRNPQSSLTQMTTNDTDPFFETSPLYCATPLVQRLFLLPNHHTTLPRSLSTLFHGPTSFVRAQGCPLRRLPQVGHAAACFRPS
jgi:hypothetical protein